MANLREKVEQAVDQYWHKLNNIDLDDVKEAAGRGRDYLMKFKENPPKYLVNLWEDIKTMVAFLRSYVDGSYRTTPWLSVAAVGAAILYFMNPLDLIPDFIPIFGYLDDAAVILLALRISRRDLDRYRTWKRKFTGVESLEAGEDEANYEEISDKK